MYGFRLLQSSAGGFHNSDHPAALFFHTFSRGIRETKQTVRVAEVAFQPSKQTSPQQQALTGKNVQKKATAGQKYSHHCLMNHKYWSPVGLEVCICSEESQSAMHLLTGKHPLARLFSRLPLCYGNLLCAPKQLGSIRQYTQTEWAV